MTWNGIALTLACGLVPGALAGTQVAGLLFFLNPHLEFSFVPLSRAMAYYALLLGLIGLAVQLPFTWDAPARARRMLPWSLVVVFASACAAHWTHASYFDFYLPAGINRRLIKAALWLSLAAVVTFYTALLHTVQRRPYGLRSRTAMASLVILSIYVVVERREAYRPTPEVVPRATFVEEVERPNLLVVGIPGATLDAVLPLAQQGQLPFLSEMIERGAHGRLETLTPTRPRPLWTSLATGRYPYRHGVVSSALYPARFAGPEQQLRLIPLGVGFDSWGVPTPSEQLPTSQTLALWEMIGRLGLETSRSGWIHEAARRPTADRVAVPASSPVDVDLWSDLTSADRAVVEPNLRLDQSRTDISRQRLREGASRAHFVRLDGLGGIARAYYGGWSAASLDGSQKEDAVRAARIVTAYYAALDAQLEKLWLDLPEPRLIALVSPFGTRPPEALELLLASIRPESAIRGRHSGAPDGLIVLRGPGVREGQFLTGVEITDVAPTLLYALGLPVARDLDGRALTEAFTDEYLARRALTFVPSYETLRPARRAQPVTADAGQTGG